MNFQGQDVLQSISVKRACFWQSLPVEVHRWRVRVSSELINFTQLFNLRATREFEIWPISGQAPRERERERIPFLNCCFVGSNTKISGEPKHVYRIFQMKSEAILGNHISGFSGTVHGLIKKTFDRFKLSEHTSLLRAANKILI